MAELTPAQRQALKARAHGLAPLVLIGDQGLTPRVLEEIDRALAARELVKLRAGALDREARAQALAEICAYAAAQPVQHIGKMLVIYRERPHAEPAPAVSTRGVTRNGRPGSRSASSRRASVPPPRPRRISRSRRGRSES